MTIEFEVARPPTTAAVVEQFEQTLPGPLPADYRAFLLSQDGGYLKPNWWPPERGKGAELRALLGLREGVASYDSLVSTRDMFLGRLPDQLLSIGYDEGDAQVCIALSEDDHGSVWVYDPEAELENLDGELVPAPLVRVCDSFTALLEGLEPEPELEEMERRYRAVDEANEVDQP